jgi:alpha-N-arabinofuranosidase
MDEIVKRHSEIMDKYDPQKRVALIVDEWGAWHAVEPGTNPGFLFQQNSLRDALVAGVSLNILNSHCDRVKMANIAQMVNVLQAMILTKDEQMILTPTYHVFEMYTVHHDATLLPVELSCRDYSFGTSTIPALNVSASKDQSGKVHISICNLDAKAPAELVCELRGAQPKKATGRMLTAETITEHNTFEKPEAVWPTDFGDFSITGGLLTVKLPAKSVVVLEVE